MTFTTLAPSFCWHCHGPLTHTAQGRHTPVRSEALAECPQCGSVFKITAAMQAVSGPAVQTFQVLVNELKGQMVSRHESGPNGRALMGTGW